MPQWQSVVIGAWDITAWQTENYGWTPEDAGVVCDITGPQICPDQPGPTNCPAAFQVARRLLPKVHGPVTKAFHGWAQRQFKASSEDATRRRLAMGASAFDQDLGWCVDDGVSLCGYGYCAFNNTLCASTSCGVTQGSCP